MPNDIMTETPEEKAAFEALQHEQPIELVQPEPEPQPEPQPEPEPKPAATPAAEPQKPVRLVPHQALHEERTKRQALERRLSEIEQRQAAQPPQAPLQSEEIDETVNPLGAIAALKAKLKTLEERDETVRRQSAEDRDVVVRMLPRIEAYKTEHPEYDEQVNFVRQSRFQELVLLGQDQHSAAAIVQREEMDLARRVLAGDMDPGDVMAKLAQARGWQQKKPDPQPEPKPAAAVVEASETLTRLKAGQKIAKSPSAAGGSGPEAEMTLERLNSLEGAAFDAAFEKHGKRLLGG